MKTLYLVRHAEAVSRKEDIPDFERTLVPRGVKQARRASQNLKNVNGHAGLLISSPAPRALETAHVFARRLGYPIQRIILQNKLYDLQDSSEALSLLRSTDDSHEVIALFGHDPLFSDLLAHLVPGVHGTMPKAGVAGVQWPVERWAEVDAGTARLMYFDASVNKTGRAKLRKEARRQLVRDIETRLEPILETLGLSSGGATARCIRPVTRALARTLLKSAGKHGFFQRQAAQRMLTRPAGETDDT